ncbi:MAG: hypothetical protein WB567_19750, partial [Terracidiphilus sp.]
GKCRVGVPIRQTRVLYIDPMKRICPNRHNSLSQYKSCPAGKLVTFRASAIFRDSSRMPGIDEGLSP